MRGFIISYLYPSNNMYTELKRIGQIWANMLSSKNSRNQLILSLVLFFAMGAINFHFMRMFQLRPGIYLNDPLLSWLHPTDFSTAIFIIEYLTVLIAIIANLSYPGRFVRGLQMYAFVILARTITIYLVPLEPPRDMIHLNDPIANLLLHTSEVFVTKDLFFSGHVAALTIIIFMSENKYVKLLALASTAIVGVLILWQHVHYSVDVIFAPVFSYVAYVIVSFIHKESRYGIELRQQEA